MALKDKILLIMKSVDDARGQISNDDGECRWCVRLREMEGRVEERPGGLKGVV